MCDLQLLTGLGILLSGYIGLKCYVSAYHWEVISYLAWFSNLTHVACLTVLRRHFYQNQVERNWRLAFMAILLVGLVTATVPTAYFNWNFRYDEGTSSVQSSDARCYYSRSLAKASRDHICLSEPVESKCHSSGTSLASTSAYQSCVMSILLLTFNFITRSIKLSKSLTYVARYNLRESLGSCYISLMTKIVERTHRIRVNLTKKESPSGTLDLLLCAYIVGKLHIDIYTSELSDVSLPLPLIVTDQHPGTLIRTYSYSGLSYPLYGVRSACRRHGNSLLTTITNGDSGRYCRYFSSLGHWWLYGFLFRPKEKAEKMSPRME